MRTFSLRRCLWLAALVSLPTAASAGTTTFRVDSTADLPDAKPKDGVCATSLKTCTLRAAVMEADALGGKQKIILKPGAYTLTRAGANEDRAATGDLDVTGKLVLQPSKGGATIKGGTGWDDRIFEVRPGARLTMKALTIADGHPVLDGGGILNGGTLILGGVSISDSSALRGGGIANFGTLTMSGSSRVEGNESLDAFDGGGGIFNGEGASATLSFTTVTGNSVSGGGPGGGIANQGTLVVKDASRITGNLAETGAPPPIGCIGGCCSGSGASRGGGGIMNDIHFDGTANPPHGTLTVIDSTVDGNRSDSSGGGISNYGVATVSGSTISNNVAHCFGGGMDEFALASNPQFAKLQMTNSTLSGNHSREGGAISHRTGPASLDYVTITGNRATFGGGINGDQFLTLGHSIVAGNALAAGGQGPDCDGPLTSAGFDLVQDTTFCDIVGDTTSNLLGHDPLLGPLADNGGPSLTHAPGGSSGAVDAVPAPCGVAADQRGVVRPQSIAAVGRGRCDIGALERESSRLLGFAIVDPATATVPAGEATTYTLTWIVPGSFAGWRAALDALDLRLRDEDGTVLWLRFDEPADGLRVRDDRKGDFGPSYPLGGPRRIETPFATLELADDALDGPPGARVSLTLDLTFKPRAAGRAYAVEVRATGDGGDEQGFAAKAQVSVLANAPRQCRLETLVARDRGRTEAQLTTPRCPAGGARRRTGGDPSSPE